MLYAQCSLLSASRNVLTRHFRERQTATSSGAAILSVVSLTRIAPAMFDALPYLRLAREIKEHAGQHDGANSCTGQTLLHFISHVSNVAMIPITANGYCHDQCFQMDRG